MATEHVGNPLKDVTEDCFVSEAISYEGEESDDNDADDDEMTTDWIDERTNKRYGGSSSTSSSSSGVITKFCLWKRPRALFRTILDFQPARESLCKKTNAFKLQGLPATYIAQRQHNQHDSTPSEPSFSSVQRDSGPIKNRKCSFVISFTAQGSTLHQRFF